MNGILNINKPYGLTSFDVVAKIKKCTGVRHVGHTGTLDPIATGVLPVCVGQATRIVEFLINATKAYQAEIELGVTTDTYDVEGQVVRQKDASSITMSQIEVSLASFRGSIMQIPPLYSAIKVQGKPLYHWARLGMVMKAKSRPVTIFEMQLVDYTPPFVHLVVVCSKGTYIRSLANELGEKLGCGAMLRSLIRMRCGKFEIKDAHLLSYVESKFRAGQGESLLLPIDSVLLDYPAVVLDEANSKKVIFGNSISISTDMDHQVFTENINLCRAYSAGGSFIAVLRYIPGENLWHPYKVFF